MRVLALTKYERKGASSRLRFLQYERHLAAHGIVLDVRPLLSNRYLEILYDTDRRSRIETLRAAGRRMVQVMALSRYDVVWLEGEVFPWAPEWLERFVLRGVRRLVVDYDDPIFLRYSQVGSGVVRSAFDSKIASIMRRADVVIAGNALLAEHAHMAGARRVEKIPTVVDCSRFPPVVPGRMSGPLNIGWIGTPQTRKYLLAVDGVLARFVAQGRARVTIIGAKAGPGLDPRFNFVPWDEASEVAAIQDFDIGIMPLPDDGWARGKSGFKLVQYMAAGRPVVASPVGANLDLVEDGATGFLADGAAAWEAALGRLIDDAPLRAAMGQRAFGIAMNRYSVDAMAPRVIKALTG